MERVVVVGCPGSGKSTVAASISDSLDRTHIELDALFHRADWTAAPVHDFRAELTDAMDQADRSAGGWVICGNYNSQTARLHIDRADTIIWLDLPRPTVMRRVTWRTVRRAITRQELWNGNRESLSNLWHWDPEKNIVRWAWVHHPMYRDRYRKRVADGSWDGLTVHHLTSQDEIDRFLAKLPN